MLFFLISCFSFLLVSQSFLKPRPASKVEPRMWVFSWEKLHKFSLSLYKKGRVFTMFRLPRFFSSENRISSSRFEVLDKIEEEKEHGISLLDLPDLALDCILEKLSPDGLHSLSSVCSSLRQKGTSDHLWEKHMKQKWGGVISEAAYKEWQCYISSQRTRRFCETQKHFPFNLFDFFLNKSELKNRENGLRSSLPSNSVMHYYLALESGKFWFPAQVFNREVANGHIGFTLSCYDALLSYDSTSDNFIARYPALGRRIMEEDINWDRIRAPVVDTPPDVLHISDCLNELKPDDHIEIQWRKNKEFPYGWWYGVVAHLESCLGNEFTCHCHNNDTLILEFKQYAVGSRWRKAAINRKDHREVGNEEDGFYGGVRKLYQKEEVARWKQLWPDCILE